MGMCCDCASIRAGMESCQPPSESCGDSYTFQVTIITEAHSIGPTKVEGKEQGSQEHIEEQQSTELLGMRIEMTNFRNWSQLVWSLV